jgi:glycosyltransferase involved in cell wall biosynthesis
MNRGIVVIPTYNEAENLPLIVPEVLEQDPRLEVLVVDDNSPDGTGRLADELAESTVGSTFCIGRRSRVSVQRIGPACVWRWISAPISSFKWMPISRILPRS